MRKPEYPKEIRVGHRLAKIYKTPTHGCDSFTVVWFEGTVRKPAEEAWKGSPKILFNPSATC